jgi:hypothetical protein
VRKRVRTVVAALCAPAIVALVHVNAATSDVFWGQWGRTSAHDGFAPATAQPGATLLASIVYDPFTDKEQNAPDGEGDLLVHYQTPLISDIDVFMAFKTGQFSTIEEWQTQTWGERKYSWVDGRLVQQWEFTSDWKPVPFSRGKDGPHWEPVYHGVLTDAAVYVPGLGGTIWKIDRTTGRVLARINPFAAIDAGTYAAGPLSADAAGNVYYNVLRLDDRTADPWLADVANSWLVKVTSSDAPRAVAWSTLVPGAPAAADSCFWQYPNESLPWPVLNANGTAALPPSLACGSQRPPVNTAPAIGPDGTIYDISRAALDDYYGYLIAVDADLKPKWISSMRNRFHDGCGTPSLPSTGTPGGCRARAPSGVSPPDGMPGSGRVLDDSTSAPVVAPDGSIYYGAYTRYNYSQGHLMRWSSAGQYLAGAGSGGFEFGWDTTPAIFQYTAANGTPTFAVVTKENHYRAGSYCNDNALCPPDRTTNHPGYPEAYFITSLSPDLTVNWRWQNTNTASCRRTGDGLTCTSDHPNGFEWCVNAPAVDATGTVLANSEDGNLYAINRNGLLLNRVFTQLAIGAAYTPLSIGPDGRIYTQNDGRLFAIGF